MDDYIKKLNIPEEHKLVQTDTKWEQRKGQDTDTYWYDEVNQEGNTVAKYVIRDSTSMYPPFGRSINHEKIIV